MYVETLSLWRGLLSDPWWVYDPRTAGAWDHLYRGFNLFEGVAWLVFATLVLLRYQRRGQSGIEILYAVTFLLFGLTDFREAYVQSAALVLVKAVILILLWRLRAHVLKHCYPTRSWF